MNALGIVIAWTAMQVTLFCLAGVAVYFAARRLNPAWRATLLCGVLLMTVGIAAIALSPWPRWLMPGDTRRPAKPMAPDAAATRDDQQAPTAAATASAVDGTSKQTTKMGGGPIAIGFLSGMWRRVQDELADKPPTGEQGRQWRWSFWLAIAALSAMGIGVARVLLGLATLARLMRNTACVTDSSMIGLVEQLRGQLHCRPTIELREMPASGAGGSPALVGWRLPVILLPEDWRSWTADARRAILAHEVAHVAHGDLGMWLAAQAGVVIHFYNPLVHWLAARLRLEQELAADARGAAIMGGAKTYAALLARMALQQDDARPLWAGCPFFPTRGTLMRRIEMLANENQKSFTVRPPKQIARTGLLAVLVLIALAISGLRGPSDTVHADGPESKQPPFADASRNANEALLPILDGSYLPADTIAVLSIRPLNLAQSNMVVEPTLLSFPMSFGFGLATTDKDKAPDWDKLREWEVEEVKAIALLAPANQDAPTGPPDPKDASAVEIYRMRRPYDRSKLRVKLFGEAPDGVTETTCHGHPCFQATSHFSGEDVSYLLVDDRTIVILRQRDVERVFAADPTSHPSWYDQWQKIAGHPMAVAFDTAALEALETAERDSYEKVFWSVLKQTSHFFVYVDSSLENFEISAAALCRSPKGATATAEAAKSGLATLVKAFTEPPQIFEASMLPKEYQSLDIPGTVVHTLSKLSVEVHETQVQIAVKFDSIIAAEFAKASKALNVRQSAEYEARAKQDEQAHQAKLARLAAAFDAYYTANGRYPPAAVIGPDGKTLHSWRVELLPYLGEQKLFESYKLDEPWDSEHNKSLVKQIPRIFSTSQWTQRGDADYFVITGKGTLFDAEGPGTRESMTDSPGDTMLVLQSQQRVPWTNPVDIEVSADHSPVRPFRGHGEGFYAAFADGTVKFVSKATDASSIRAMFTKAGGEEVKLR